MTSAHHTQDQIQRDRREIVALIFMDGMDVVAASARYVVVLVWRPCSTPFPGAIAPGGPPARLLASLLFSDAPRLPVGLMHCPE